MAKTNSFSADKWQDSASRTCCSSETDASSQFMHIEGSACTTKTAKQSANLFGTCLALVSHLCVRCLPPFFEKWWLGAELAEIRLNIGCEFRSHNTMRNKRLRSFLSDFNQSSSRFAMQELFGHSARRSLPLVRNLSRTGAFTGGQLRVDGGGGRVNCYGMT